MSGLFDQVAKVVLPIISIGPDAAWTPFGTCFVVALLQPKRAIALTAAHNLDYLASLESRGTRHHPTTPPEFQNASDWIELKRTRPSVLASGKTGPVIGEVTHARWNDASDVGLVLLTLPEDEDAVFEGKCVLDTRPLSGGEQVVAFGYHGMSAPFTAEPDYKRSDIRIRMEWELSSRPGPVVEVHPNGTGMYKWPGFLVGAALDSGMSGGPVLDLSSAVRGVVCGDMSEDAEAGAAGSGARAFASALWPSMAIRPSIAVSSPEGSPEIDGNAPFFEWARHGLVEDRGASHEHVKIVTTPDGKEHFSWHD